MIGDFCISPWGRMANRPLVWSYDGFPFGMLMPGRYISDTSDHCMTISRSNWTTEMADTCKPLATLESTAYLYGGSTINTSGSSIVLHAEEYDSWIQLTTEVEAGIDNSFSFDVPVLEGAEESGMQVMIIETRDNTPYVIGGGYLMPGGRKQTIFFKASGNTVNVLFNGPFSTAEIEQICTHYTKSTQQTYLVEVCDESKDKYRFGFNGQMKDNELKGVGNSLDFGARIYDSRLGRFLSLDPLAIKYPYESNYTYAGNTPIYLKDIDGKFKWPGDKAEQKKWEEKYPYFTRYMKENLANDMTSSKLIMEVLYKNSVGALTKSQITKDSKYGEGPVITPTLTGGGRGRLDFNQMDYSKSKIMMNPDLIQGFEDAMNPDAQKNSYQKQMALTMVYQVLLHEYTHYGDALDGQSAVLNKDSEIVNGTGPNTFFGDWSRPPDGFEEGQQTDMDIWKVGSIDSPTQFLYMKKIRGEGKVYFNANDAGSKSSNEVDLSVKDPSVLPTVPTTKQASK